MVTVVSARPAARYQRTRKVPVNRQLLALALLFALVAAACRHDENELTPPPTTTATAAAAPGATGTQPPVASTPAQSATALATVARPNASASTPGISGAEGTPGAPRATPTAAAPVVSAPCTFPGDALGKTVTMSVATPSGTREYLLHLPPSEAEAMNGPIVLNFHAAGSDMATQEAASGLASVADQAGFVLVTPNGSGPTRGWYPFGGTGSGDDVAFVRELLDALKRESCIDSTTAYAAGSGTGAMMASLAACSLGGRVAAVLLVGGVYLPAASCTRTPVLAFHGTEDTSIPYGPGDVPGVLPYPGAEKAAYDWAMNNGCAPVTGKADQLAPGTFETSYSQCGGGADVSLVTINGGGSAWPSLATQMAWSFFAAHPRR